ncbi:MAG: tyrosine-type recombinase/integrase [Deltaproteobacteria bacterium]|jgi:integrase|nr:tyrosine-type recombinase/integrase [Deltaproteobacteria bacterium]
MKVNLTQHFLTNVKHNGKRQTFSDIKMPGLELRLGAKGHKSFYIFYRVGKGQFSKLRRFQLGVYPNVDINKARQLAKIVIARVASGFDPVIEKKREKNMSTVEEGFRKYEIDYMRIRLKRNTIITNLSIINKKIIPAIGKLKITEVTTREIINLHTQLKDTPYTANRSIAILKTFFNWNEEMELRPSGTNPVKRIKLFKEEKKQLFLNMVEIAKIGEAIVELKKTKSIDHLSVAAFRLLFLTGARKSEILTLQWSNIDYLGRKLILPDSKTGFKVIQLSTAAIEVLKSIPITTSIFVFPGRGGTGHIADLKHQWKKILAKAKINGRWRIHDLRHAFASVAVNAGANLSLIGSLLGHKSNQTTYRYAHIADSAVQFLAEKTGNIVASVLNGKLDP